MTASHKATLAKARAAARKIVEARENEKARVWLDWLHRETVAWRNMINAERYDGIAAARPLRDEHIAIMREAPPLPSDAAIRRVRTTV